METVSLTAKIALLTAEEIKQLVTFALDEYEKSKAEPNAVARAIAEIKRKHEAEEKAKAIEKVVGSEADTADYIYGIEGICKLFNVSATTAQKYKRTFLAPIVKQRGRKIWISRSEAMKLYLHKTDK